MKRKRKPKRTNKPGAGRPITKAPTHQIAPRVSEKAYRNFLSVPAGKRSQWVSDKLEDLFHVKQFELPAEPAAKSELLSLMETEIKNISKPNLEEMGASERAYFESLNEQTSETTNETNTDNPDNLNPKPK